MIIHATYHVVPQNPTGNNLCGKMYTGRNTQMLFFKAAAGKAFTIFFAGLALTMTTFPKISFLPAFVAGFVRVLRRQSCGIEKTPVFATSFDATSARVFNKVEATFCLSSPM